MNREQELKPCPFCGSGEVSSEGTVDNIMFCGNCGAFGPHPAYDEATWNTRAALSAPKAEAKKNIGTIAHVDHGKTSLTAIAASLLAAREAEAEEPCPVCAKPFAPGDTCATDIELGKCHAECLAGSPTVDLETGEPVDGPIGTFPHVAPKAEAMPVAYMTEGCGCKRAYIDREAAEKLARAGDGTIIPLYTSPVPALTDEAVERAARELERKRQTEWTDEEIDTWWNRDPFFCEDVTSWGHFTGTRKEYCIWQAKQILAAFPSKGEGE